MQETTLNALKILIVEDNEIAMKVNHMMLMEAGYVADGATSGEEALGLVSNYDYDVIFMDIGLPKISGIEATVEIRKMEAEQSKKRSCIVALTAYGTDESIKAKCFTAGMDFFKPKPTTADELQQILAQF